MVSIPHFPICNTQLNNLHIRERLQRRNLWVFLKHFDATTLDATKMPTNKLLVWY